MRTIQRMFSGKFLNAFAVSALLVGAFACGAPVAPTDAGGTEDPDGTDDTVAIGDGADTTTTIDGDSAAHPDTENLPDGTETSAVTEIVGEGVVIDALPDGTTAVDAEIVEDVPSVPDGTKPKTLPLPACAGKAGDYSEKTRCANCKLKCDKDEICGGSTTYYNDCEAICLNSAYDGLEKLVPPVDFLPQPCPACKECKVTDKFDKFPWCVTLKSGAEIEVQLKCEIGCTDFKPKSATDLAPSAVWGLCKSSCSKPAPGGPGCSLTKYKPLCAKEDGKTYAGQCHMENCDLQGCSPVGEMVKTAACAPQKMTKECDGECFDKNKTPNCPETCDPVCGIKPNKYGQTYRNACVAVAASAPPIDCKNVSSTAADICSASLYKGKGCCGDVDYSLINPICASQTVAGKETFVTFRTQAEFDCMTTNQVGWQFKYVGPCVCSCEAKTDLVCGDDGQNYNNACFAECYNPGGKFGYKPGACK